MMGMDAEAGSLRVNREPPRAFFFFRGFFAFAFSSGFGLSAVPRWP